MNKLIPKIGAVIVAVTVFLFAVCMIVKFHFGSYLVCMFLPIGYIMMAAGFQQECCEARRVSANIGLIFSAIYAALIFLVYFAQTTSVTVETLMGIATVGIIPAQLLSITFGWSHLPAHARFTGFCVGMVGDLIFLISVLCMKDSWRADIPDKDRTELVTDGIYAYSRNPAFLGFDLQYIGVLLMYCNLLTGIFTVSAIVMLHLQIMQEERYLTTAFGTEYLDYHHQVFRYLGRRKEKRNEKTEM